MKLLSSLVVLASVLAFAEAECMDSVEYMIGEATKLSFSGFIPSIKRITNTGVGNKVVLRGYTRMPEIVEEAGNVLAVKAGEPCSVDGGLETNPGDVEGGDGGNTTEGGGSSTSSASSMKQLLTFSMPFLMGRSIGIPGGVGSALLTTLALTSSSSSSFVRAQSSTVTAECESVPIEVDIYVDGTAADIVMMNSKSGQFEVCPTETLYWEHHPKVFGGYSGCVGESAYMPCAQDSQGLDEEEGEFYKYYPLNWDGEKCVPTGYDASNRTYWVLWGHPSDKYELNLRTGLNPVVSFPFNRGPYPDYQIGVPLDIARDDSADARAMAKDLLVYIGAFTEAELEGYEVTFTEGAESGMVYIWAGKALEIARTTCNRDIYALMEVPAYGYTPSDVAAIVNTYADSFYNSSECICYETDSCKAPTVTISNRGWLPLTDFPVELGGDNTTYAADSTSSSSPWIESMVFPENPTGKLKTPQLSADRRVCDGVYLWPMYFGGVDYKIPIDLRPDCSAWSFSITKAYSASVRAGFILYKNDVESSKQAMVDAITVSYSMTNGLYSEWSWYGQMQLWEMIMSKPYTEPDSWIGAFSSIVDEKWNVLIEAFENCPVLTLSNPKAGAYAWFVYNPEYTGVQNSFISSFFRDVLGILTTTYNWGFRGADPADFYGEGYTETDFTRLQLYRDVTVYDEIARRAKIVCNDLDATIGNFVSINQWEEAGRAVATRRRLLSSEDNGYASREDRERHLKESVPTLTHRQLEYLVNSHESSDTIDANVKLCAPDFSTSCLFDKVGTRFADF